MSARIDAHVHVLGAGTEGARQLARIERDYTYETANFLSAEGMNDAAQNALGIYFKLLDPSHYAFGGFHYRFAYDFAAELESLHAIGFDGIKMIENKPTERRRLGFRQDDPRYEAAYALAQELDFPFLIHVNDPRDFWDKDLCPDWARTAGFFYGDAEAGWPSYEQILAETLGMLERFPRLRICCAHLLFLSDDEPRLRRLIEEHQNLYLDVTAGTEMYFSFGRDPERWRRFFTDFQDRIFFGTDNANRFTEEDKRIADELNRVEQTIFSSHGTLTLWGETIYGLALPESVTDKLYAENFRHFAGACPRKLDREKAAAYLERRLEDTRFALTQAERQIINEILLILKN